MQSQSDNTDRSRHHRQDISDLLQARNPFSFLLSSSLPYMANSSQATPCHFVPHSHPPSQPMVSAPAKSRIIGVRCATTLTSNPRAPALPCTDMREAALALRFPLDVVSCGKPAGLYDTRQKGFQRLMAANENRLARSSIVVRRHRGCSVPAHRCGPALVPVCGFHGRSSYTASLSC